MKRLVIALLLAMVTATGGWAFTRAGLDAFGQPNVNGPNLQGPAAVGGLRYGITPAGDTSATFTLNGPGSFAGDLGSLFTNVSFQYGTDSSEPNSAPPPPVPEQVTILLLGGGLFCLAVFGKRRMNH
ncbi:hypothetical protein [Oryzomonas rubra]|uniref:PEP-CTERM protein-sorting domain-containing protein n=1 Tax=Oryzomonas rubra TaxID=2509454 RepID=A0A5A9XML6_9BACT|nr:hypothetical protein [Oryzomonas rubra]KAA0894174.1 hypothetical protein ET418_04250 [Oryzomonas rubra]